VRLLPGHIRIEHCDIDELEVQPGSVRLVVAVCPMPRAASTCIPGSLRLPRTRYSQTPQPQITALA